MSSIEASNYSASRINPNTIMVEFDCKTNVKPNIKFDFSVNHSKPINIITSSSIYQQLHNEVLDRTNINSEEIKGENDLKRKKTKLCLNKESLVIHTYKVQRKGPGMVRTNVNWCGLLIDTYEQRVKERHAKRNLERAKKNAS